MKSLRPAPRTGRTLGWSAGLRRARGDSIAGATLRQWSLFLVSLALLLLVPLTPASGDGRPSGGGGDQDFSAGEGEGSLPAGADLSAGIGLVGPQEDVFALVVSVAGPGQVEVIPLDEQPGNPTVLVLFHGNLTVRIDRLRLATSNVTVHFFSGVELLGGMAQAGVDHAIFAPFLIDQVLYDLPFAAMFATEEPVVPRFGIEAVGRELERYRLDAQARGDVVRLIQRTNF
ncbi:MAG: hypothetical protein AB1726_11400 [Planctomycetota bacterium]